MSEKAKKIAERYLEGYVTDEQLERYRALGVISDAEYETIWALRHGSTGEDITDAEVVDIITGVSE